MTTAVIAFTRRGAALGRSLADALGGTLHVPARFAPEVGAEAYASLEGWTAWAWARADALVFVGAAGIAVRAIATHVRDKFSDPAVVSVDEAGRFNVPSSRHVGRQRAGPEGSRPHRRTGGGVHRHRCQRPVRRGRVGPGAGHGHHRPGPGQGGVRRPAGGNSGGFCQRLRPPLPGGPYHRPGGAGGVDHRPDGGGALPPRPASGAPEPDSGHRLPPGDAGGRHCGGGRRRPGGPRPRGGGGRRNHRPQEGRARPAGLLRPAGPAPDHLLRGGAGGGGGGLHPLRLCAGITGVDNVCERAAAAGGRIIVPKQATTASPRRWRERIRYESNGNRAWPRRRRGSHRPGPGGPGGLRSDRGYTAYIDLVRRDFPQKETLSTGMRGRWTGLCRRRWRPPRTGKDVAGGALRRLRRVRHGGPHLRGGPGV